MTAVKTRLDRLERQMGGANGPGLFVVARCGADDDELNVLLAERGIDPDDPRHTVVVLQSIFEDRDGGIAPKQGPAEILSITEQK
jgi:hypothetical protein